VRTLVRDLNRLYREKPSLHARDCESEGFGWLVADDKQNSVFAWLRQAPGSAPIAVICNMTPVPREAYALPLPAGGIWKEMVNSDAVQYGGSGLGNMGSVTVKDGHARLMLPPLATIMLEHNG